MSKYLHYIYGAIILIALSSMAWAWFHPKTIVNTVYQPINVIGTAPKPEVVVIPCHPIKVVKYVDRFIAQKPEIKDFVKPDEQITGQTIISPNQAPTTVITKINKEGDTTFIAIPQKRSFFGFENGKIVGLRLGYDDGFHKTGELYGSWDFARVMNGYIGAYWELNTEKTGKAMLQLSYHFN